MRISARCFAVTGLGGALPWSVNAAFIAGDGVVLFGDCLVNAYRPNLACGTQRERQQWLDSLERIASLAPRAIVPGYGPVVLESEASRLMDAVRQELSRAIAQGSDR